MSHLLDGIRVLDLTNVLAGPFCGYQLAQLGAEVIKIEMPKTGDLARQLGADPELNRRLMGASFLAQNAGKKSLTLNLKNEGGKELFRRLVVSADVVVENFRPGVMERLDLGYISLKNVRPEIIYCAISGFGQTGPLRDNPAYDQIIQGLSGVMSVTGGPETAPLRVGYPVCDTIGGMTAAFAVAAALYRRSVTGEGEFIDVSMLEATLGTMGWAVSNHLIADVDPEPMGNENMTASPSGAFRTGDGLLNIAANKQEQFETLCRLVGCDELIIDPHFAEREARKRYRYELKEKLEQALAKASAEHWETVLNRAGVPAGRVLSVPQALATPQVAGRGFVHHLPNAPGVDRDIAVVRSGMKLGQGDPEPAFPPPTLGQHTDEVLAQLGTTAEERQQLREDGVI